MRRGRRTERLLFISIDYSLVLTGAQGPGGRRRGGGAESPSFGKEKGSGNEARGGGAHGVEGAVGLNRPAAK